MPVSPLAPQRKFPALCFEFSLFPGKSDQLISLDLRLKNILFFKSLYHKQDENTLKKLQLLNMINIVITIKKSDVGKTTTAAEY